MERGVVVEPLKKRFVVSLRDANKQTRNRSYPNASDCCGARLKQEKFCSVCNQLSHSCQRKIVKIGKEEHLVDASLLKQAVDALEGMEDIKLTSFLKRRPSGAEDRFDALIYVYPAKKHEGAYVELAEILKGRTAVGTGVFRGNEYQILVEVGDDGIIRMRKLVGEERRYDMLDVNVDFEVNWQIIELENKILDKVTVEDVDLTKFKDTRTAIEERIIEEVVLNGKVPEVKSEVRQERDLDEIERLRALAGE